MSWFYSGWRSVDAGFEDIGSEDGTSFKNGLDGLFFPGMEERFKNLFSFIGLWYPNFELIFSFYLVFCVLIIF